MFVTARWSWCSWFDFRLWARFTHVCLFLLLLLLQGIKGQRYCRMDKPCSIIVDKLNVFAERPMAYVHPWGLAHTCDPRSPGPMDVCTTDGLKEKGPGGSSNATMADYGRGVWHYCFTISSHIKPIYCNLLHSGLCISSCLICFDGSWPRTDVRWLRQTWGWTLAGVLHLWGVTKHHSISRS